MRVSPHFPTFYTIQLIKAEKEKRKINGEARSDIIPVIEMESWTWITTQHLFFVCFLKHLWLLYELSLISDLLIA